MKQVYRMGLALAACWMATAPAMSAVFVSADGKKATITADGQGVNQFSIFTTGNQADRGTDLAGLNGLLVFNLIGGFNTNRLLFEYTLTNVSTLNNIGSSIAVFGFSVDPNADLQIRSGEFREGSNGNFNGVRNLEHCVFDGSNCNGGASEGVFVDTATNRARGRDVVARGTFDLVFAQKPTRVEFSSFMTRWQRVGLNGAQSASGTGTVLPPVPEPSQWAMMIAGFAVVGGAMRARRRRELALA